MSGLHQDDTCAICGEALHDGMHDGMCDGPPEKPRLTDFDVRIEEVGNRVEFATFCEGEYVESVFVSRERALEIFQRLSALLAEMYERESKLLGGGAL